MLKQKKKDPFYTEEAKEADRKEELDRINNLLIYTHNPIFIIIREYQYKL